MGGRGIRGLLLKRAARHRVVEGVGDNVRRQTLVHHRGHQLVVKFRTQVPSNIRRVGLQRMVMVRRHQRTVLVMGRLVDGRLFARDSKFVTGRRTGAGLHRPAAMMWVVVRLLLLLLVRLSRLLLLLVLEPLLSPQVATIFEHVTTVRMEGPERALARLVWRARNFDETVVEAQRVPDGVLPALLVLSVEGKVVHDELVDLRQGEHLARRVLDRHGDQADVRIGWFRVRVVSPVRLVRSGALQGRVRRLGVQGGQRVPTDRGRRAGERTVPADGHAGVAWGHGAGVGGHRGATQVGHAEGRAHAAAAHVEMRGTLRAAVGRDTHTHRHADRHTAHRVHGTGVRVSHAPHVGHGGGSHRPAEAGLVREFRRLKHGHNRDF